MTSIEIKTEIQKALDNIPENALPDILDFIRNLQYDSIDKVILNHQLKKILEEDNYLLKRLAQ